MTKAQHLVDRLLEYGFDQEERAGGPEDPWRKSGLKTMPFTSKDFLGRRHGEPVPVEDEDDDGIEDKPKAIPVPIKKVKSRFDWKPPKQV